MYNNYFFYHVVVKLHICIIMKGMRCILFCTAGFFCLFLLDLFQIQRRKALSRICSIIGYIHIAAGLFLLLVSYKIVHISSLFLLMQVAGAVCFFALLVFSVFIEIGLKSPYSEFNEREAIDTGTYGLVRHPGFIWFLLLILILISLYRNLEFALIALTITFMNFGLVLIEDLILFPKLFVNYDDYKLKVPFIIPRLRIITRILRSVHEETD